MNGQELTNQVSAIRKQIVDTYNKIMGIQNPLLPPKDRELLAMEEQLKHDVYDVVVCGEVKKGKSSFINAILGEAILPVNTEVATSQVFRIVNSDTESYELVFMDETRKAISKDDLTRYGSQVAANADGTPMFASSIDYIEIHYPITFLPKNIAIVDTPGIGAVYADHERITRRYLKRAAAVVFIMDPQNPLTEPEIAFVKSALEVTNQMVFVMTKMDNYDSEYIVNMVRRNGDILNPLAEQTYSKHISVLPMSSKILADAAQNDDEVLRDLDVISSQFDKVREALERMIYTTVGLVDNVVFTNRMIAYNTKVLNVIQESTNALNDNGQAKQLLEDKKNLQNKFSAQWGPTGPHYKEVAQQISDETNSISNRIAVMCNPAGTVYQKFQEEINVLKDKAEAEEYAKAFPTRLKETIEHSVRDVLESISNSINGKLKDYASNMNEQVEFSNDITLDGIALEGIDTGQKGFAKVLGTFRMTYLTSAIFLGIGGMLLGPIGALLGGIFGGIASWLTTKETFVNELKGKYLNYLGKTLNGAYTELCVKANPITKVEEIRRDIKAKAENALKQVYDEQKQAVDERVKVLTEQIQADTQERQKKQTELSGLRTAWKPIHTHLTELKQSIEQLEKKLETA
ncbi:MAG: dynamin family protein [Bacteroidales bacterium]|nr:dynamin family protein [Bacteroidales bacterium]